MFGIGMPELIIILAVALIVIGPKKLPDLAKSLGRALGEFKKATNDLKDSIYVDNEIKDVKETFEKIKADTRNAVTEKPETKERSEKDHRDKAEAEATSPPAEPLDQVKHAFDEMNQQVADSDPNPSETKPKNRES